MKGWLLVFLLVPNALFSQLKWTNVDSLYGPLPAGVHIYFTEDRVDTMPFRAFYLVADLKNKKLDFTTDTTLDRRLTPSEFHERNGRPVAVVNGTFFSFATNRNLNLVIKNGKLLAHDPGTVKIRVGDTTQEVAVFRSAIGISKKRKPDIAWIRTDSSSQQALASQYPVAARKGNYFYANKARGKKRAGPSADNYLPWKMQTAIGGGPVLVQQGEICITNEFEQRFAGAAISDKHPRTAMGYNSKRQLIILVIEGRNPQAGGATLWQQARIMKDLGCLEALNLDGGGSSCLLVNGKETIRPSDKKQRPVPAVFMIMSRD